MTNKVILVVAAFFVGSVVIMTFKPADIGPEVTTGASGMPLSASTIGGGKVLEGVPVESGSGRLGVTSDDSSFAAIWECTPGKFSWSYGWDETIYLLEGRVTLWHNGVGTEVRGGDLITFHAGSEVIWDVHEKVRKVAFLHRPSVEGRLKKWIKSWMGGMV